MQPLWMQIEIEKPEGGGMGRWSLSISLSLSVFAHESQTQLSPDETQFPITLSIYYIISLYTWYHIAIMHIWSVWVQIANKMLINAHSL